MPEFVQQRGYPRQKGIAYVWSDFERPGSSKLDRSTLLGQPDQSGRWVKEGSGRIEGYRLEFATALYHGRDVWIDERTVSPAFHSLDHVFGGLSVDRKGECAEDVRRVGFALLEPGGARVVAIKNLEDFGACRSDGLPLLSESYQRCLSISVGFDVTPGGANGVRRAG